MENNDQQQPQEQEKINEEVKDKTAEDLAWEEQLQKRLEELRKRDPFIYR